MSKQTSWKGPFHKWRLDTELPCVCVLSHCSRVCLFATPRTIALQARLSMGSSKQGYLRGVPCHAELPPDGLQPHRLPHARLLCPWDSPSKDTAVGCHALLSCLKDPQIEHSGPQIWKRA